MTIVIIGIGQSFRGDDGAGLEAVRTWQDDYPQSASHPEARIEWAEVIGLSVLDDLIGTDGAILVDAVRSGGTPGSVMLIDESQLAAFNEGSGSAHGLGVAEALLLGRRLYPHQIPEKVVLIGIEVGDINFGKELSLPVRQSLPAAANLIEIQFQRLINRVIRE